MWVRPLEELLCIDVYVSVLVQHMCYTAGALAYVCNEETKGGGKWLPSHSPPYGDRVFQ